MPARHPSVVAAVESQVDIWEDPTRVVFAADQQIVADVKFDPPPAVHDHQCHSWDGWRRLGRRHEYRIRIVQIAGRMALAERHGRLMPTRWHQVGPALRAKDRPVELF